jgi:hypothetical protein
MSRVGGGIVQHHFGVRGDRDATWYGGVVLERDSTQLDVGVGRDADLRRRLDPAVGAADLRESGREVRRVRVGLRAHRLRAGGPDGAALLVPQVHERAVRVARAVRNPARERDGVVARRAGPGRGDDRREAPVGEHLRGRRVARADVVGGEGRKVGT